MGAAPAASPEGTAADGTPLGDALAIASAATWATGYAQEAKDVRPLKGPAAMAYAAAAPPAWLRTAAAAELWAVLLLLAEPPNVPPIVTDCLAILTAARSGTATTLAPRSGRRAALMSSACATSCATAGWSPAT